MRLHLCQQVVARERQIADRFPVAAILVRGTRAAKRHAAAKLCWRQSQHVPQVPQEGHVGIAIERALFPFTLSFTISSPSSIQASSVERLQGRSEDPA